MAKKTESEIAELLEALDARLDTFAKTLAADIDQRLSVVDTRIEPIERELQELGRELQDQRRDFEALDALDYAGDVDDGAEDILPEVREARRILGHDCPDDIAERAASLRKRGHRLRLDGLRFASARAKREGNPRTSRPVERAGAVNMSGEKTKVFDHNGKLVASGVRRRD